MTAWRCTSCGGAVELVEALEHFNSCAGGDRDEAAADSCVLCDAPADAHGELCDACAEVAQ